MNKIKKPKQPGSTCFMIDDVLNQVTTTKQLAQKILDERFLDSEMKNLLTLIANNDIPEILERFNYFVKKCCNYRKIYNKFYLSANKIVENFIFFQSYY